MGLKAFFNKKLLNRQLAHIILISLLGLLVYSNTFNVPFQFDDEPNIVKNSIIKDFHYFLEPSRASGSELYGFFKSRFIGYLTFALNYKIHGLDVTGYHIVNLGIHIINAMLVYFLVVLTCKTPFLNQPSLKESSNLIALFSSLLFVSHPIQTQAVTYIVQRFTSLATMFYLLSLALYIMWRLTPPCPPLARGGMGGISPLPPIRSPCHED